MTRYLNKEISCFQKLCLECLEWCVTSCEMMFQSCNVAYFILHHSTYCVVRVLAAKNAQKFAQNSFGTEVFVASDLTFTSR